jgi:hypothetical protein
MPAITYEITAVVPDSLCADFERFMIDRHIPDLLKTGAFAGATFSRSSPGRYRIRYEAYGQESLGEYLEKHAPLLRAHVAERFPEGIEFTREEWEILASFDGRSARNGES